MEVEIVSNKLNISLKNLGKRKIYGIERKICINHIKLIVYFILVFIK